MQSHLSLELPSNPEPIDYSHYVAIINTPWDLLHILKTKSEIVKFQLIQQTIKKVIYYDESIYGSHTAEIIEMLPENQRFTVLNKGIEAVKNVKTLPTYCAIIIALVLPTEHQIEFLHQYCRFSTRDFIDLSKKIISEEKRLLLAINFYKKLHDNRIRNQTIDSDDYTFNSFITILDQLLWPSRTKLVSAYLDDIISANMDDCRVKNSIHTYINQVFRRINRPDLLPFAVKHVALITNHFDIFILLPEKDKIEYARAVIKIDSQPTTFLLLVRHLPETQKADFIIEYDESVTTEKDLLDLISTLHVDLRLNMLVFFEKRQNLPLPISTSDLINRAFRLLPIPDCFAYVLDRLEKVTDYKPDISAIYWESRFNEKGQGRPADNTALMTWLKSTIEAYKAYSNGVQTELNLVAAIPPPLKNIIKDYVINLKPMLQFFNPPESLIKKFNQENEIALLNQIKLFTTAIPQYLQEVAKFNEHPVVAERVIIIQEMMLMNRINGFSDKFLQTCHQSELDIKDCVKQLKLLAEGLKSFMQRGYPVKNFELPEFGKYIIEVYELQKNSLYEIACHKIASCLINSLKDINNHLTP